MPSYGHLPHQGEERRGLQNMKKKYITPATEVETTTIEAMLATSPGSVLKYDEVNTSDQLVKEDEGSDFWDSEW